MYFDIDYSTWDDACLVENESAGYSFDAFRSKHPAYLENLRNRTAILYRTYVVLHGSHYSKLKKDPQMEETASLLGYGLLMRHALEAISIDLVRRAGLEAQEKTANTRLKALEGQTISGYNRDQEQKLFYILDKTNQIAHPHVIETAPSYESFVNLYTTTFRPLIDFHIGLTTNRSIKRYLRAIQKRLDNFNLKESITRTLTLGNLVRQLTECTANLWCYNNSFVPTDMSTFENQISLSSVLTQLGRIAKINRDSGYGTSSMTCETITALFSLKNTSNALMHVTHDEISLFKIRREGRKLRALHTSIVCECSPDALASKIDPSVRNKNITKLTLLCGFFGWFGVHHFYAGNILMGILFLLTCGGFLVGPIVSLVNICCGNFRTKKWGDLNKASKANIALAIAFIVLYIVLLRFIFFK